MDMHISDKGDAPVIEEKDSDKNNDASLQKDTKFVGHDGYVFQDGVTELLKYYLDSDMPGYVLEGNIDSYSKTYNNNTILHPFGIVPVSEDGLKETLEFAIKEFKKYAPKSEGEQKVKFLVPLHVKSDGKEISRDSLASDGNHFSALCLDMQLSNINTQGQYDLKFNAQYADSFGSKDDENFKRIDKVLKGLECEGFNLDCQNVDLVSEKQQYGNTLCGLYAAQNLFDLATATPIKTTYTDKDNDDLIKTACDIFCGLDEHDTEAYKFLLKAEHLYNNDIEIETVNAPTSSYVSPSANVTLPATVDQIETNIPTSNTPISDDLKNLMLNSAQVTEFEGGSDRLKDQLTEQKNSMDKEFGDKSLDFTVVKTQMDKTNPNIKYVHYAPPGGEGSGDEIVVYKIEMSADKKSEKLVGIEYGEKADFVVALRPDINNNIGGRVISINSKSTSDIGDRRNGPAKDQIINKSSSKEADLKPKNSEKNESTWQEKIVRKDPVQQGAVR